MNLLITPLISTHLTRFFAMKEDLPPHTHTCLPLCCPTFISQRFPRECNFGSWKYNSVERHLPGMYKALFIPWVAERRKGKCVLALPFIITLCISSLAFITRSVRLINEGNSYCPQDLFSVYVTGHLLYTKSESHFVSQGLLSPFSL